MFKKYRAFTLLLVLLVTSCGTILHPERKGQYSINKRLDLAMVALNASSVLLFPPLTVAMFAVDFKTQAIYLPAEEIILHDETPKNIQKRKQEQALLEEQEKERLRLEEEARMQEEEEAFPEQTPSRVVPENYENYSDDNLFD